MNALGYLVGMLLIVGYVWNTNYQTALEDQAAGATMALSGQLRAYGSFAKTYAAANPALDASITDAQAAIPTWLAKPPGARAWAKGGKAYVYITPDNLAAGYAAARACKRFQVCGIAQGGALYEPGKTTATVAALPSAVPNGALVYVK